MILGYSRTATTCLNGYKYTGYYIRNYPVSSKYMNFKIYVY